VGATVDDACTSNVEIEQVKLQILKHASLRLGRKSVKLDWKI